MRVWHKCISPKQVHEELGIYHGTLLPEMDRCWESEDGYSVMSRLIRTAWGNVEHVTIEKMGTLAKESGTGDIPWKVKQEIKNELFGEKRCAIEVFPAEKNLIDAMDVYHLWVFSKDFTLPFGIHPIRDTQCHTVKRGYDVNIAANQEWIDSDTRKKIMADDDASFGALLSGSALSGLNAKGIGE